MKAWAVFMVICAHCGGVPLDAPMVSQIVSLLLGILGSLGVPIFFFLAGYVVRDKALKPWLKGKLTGLLIPWFTCGLLVYLYVHLRKGGISLESLLLWLVGDGTYLWYLSVQVLLLLWARVVFWGIRKNLWSPPSAVGISILLSVGALALEALKLAAFHPYLNIFRWMWLFALGMAAGHVKLLEKAVGRILLIPLWGSVLAALWVLEIPVNYWTWTFPVCACLTVAVVMNGFIPTGKAAVWLRTLGEDSFAIYLLHMPVAGVVANLCGRIPDGSGLLTLSRPVIVLIVTQGCVLLLKMAGKHLGMERLICVLFGIRSGKGIAKR